MTNNPVFDLTILGAILRSNEGVEFVRKIGCLENFMSRSHGWYVNPHGSGSLGIKYNDDLRGVVDTLHLTEEGYSDLLAIDPDKPIIADRSGLGLSIQDAFKAFQRHKFKNERGRLFPIGYNALLLVDFSTLDTPVEFWKTPVSRRPSVDAFNLASLADNLRQPIVCHGSDPRVAFESIEASGFSAVSGTQLLTAFYQAQLMGLLQSKELYFFWLCVHDFSFPLTRLISSLLINWERYLAAEFVSRKESYLSNGLKSELQTMTPLWVWNMALLCSHMNYDLNTVLDYCVNNAKELGAYQDASAITESLSLVKILVRFLIDEPIITSQYGVNVLPSRIVWSIVNDSKSMN